MPNTMCYLQPSNANLMSRQLRKLQTNLRSSLADFTSFLLTKEQTHFSMLSVITNYPGLAHFVYTDGTGVIVQPIVTDLRHQAEAFGISRWRDLSVNILNAAVGLIFILNVTNFLYVCTDYFDL